MKLKKHKMLWRWLGLASILASFVFNYVSFYVNIGIGSISEVTATYRNYFTPAGYTFSIWGVIYLSFLVYTIFQLLPSQRNERLYDRISITFIMINLLGIFWQIAFRSNYITLSLFIIVAMLLFGIRAYKCTKVYQLQHRRTCLYTVPFSLFLSWICLATIANASAWLVYMNYTPSLTVATTMAAILLLVSFILGIVISIRFRDFVFPIVIAWGSIGIWYKFSFDNALVAGVALFTGVVLIVSGIFSAAWHFWLRYVFNDKPLRLYSEA